MRPSIVASLLLLLITATTAIAATPDPQGYARLLIPVFTYRDHPGGYGSVWRSELVIRNAGTNPVEIFQQLCVYFCSCSIIGTCSQGSPTPPQSNFGGTVIQDDLVRNDGVFVYVQRRYAEDVVASLRVRDLSRTSDSAGTSIPVVREQDLLTKTAVLLNVPFDAGFRQHLRVYGVYSPSGESDVMVRFFRSDGNGVLYERRLRIIPSLGAAALPPAGEYPAYPAFAEMADLASLVPELVTAGGGRIEIEPITPGLVFWAFVSVTNNSSQEFTAITP